MGKSQLLYTYLKKNSKEISNEWYNSIEDNDSSSVYASKDPNIVKKLKEQNLEFNLLVNEMFIADEKIYSQKFDEWIMMIAQDTEHLRTPIPNVIREFIRVRNLYLTYMDKFVEQAEEKPSQEEISEWKNLLLKAFDTAIYKFVEDAYKNSTNQLKAQQHMINELSSPVIILNKDVGLLPLVGDIDTARAKMILENTLKQCAKKGINHLYIDLSGVLMIDTMVAHQIFQLLSALKLLGVKSTLSGIRPEIALTATQLGLSFEEISIKSNLAQALATGELKI